MTSVRDLVLLHSCIASCLGSAAAARPSRAASRFRSSGTRWGPRASISLRLPDGYDSTSLVRVDMKGLNYALSKTETLSAAND